MDYGRGTPTGVPLLFFLTAQVHEHKIGGKTGSYGNWAMPIANCRGTRTIFQGGHA